jgi:hypothetical protein
MGHPEQGNGPESLKQFAIKTARSVNTWGLGGYVRAHLCKTICYEGRTRMPVRQIGGPVNADALTEDAPSPGSGVSLLPMDAPGVVILSELASWYSSPGGLVVTARVAVPPETADALSGAQVWASAHTDRTDTLVVFSAVARSVRPRAGELELTGMTTIAREPRRRSVRATVAWPATVLVGDGVPARTKDLSRGGCRLHLDDAAAVGTMQTGQQVELEVSLGGSDPIRVAGRTVRVDLTTGELTIRFLDLPRDIAARLDRIVFEELSPAAP